MTLLSGRYEQAFAYAHDLHRAQRRKGTPIPYVAHLMTVSALVIEHGGTEDQAIAALLHDAAEDQGGEATLAEIRDRFGELVSAIVADCTDAWTEPKPPWQVRKEAYIAALPHKPATSLLVSLADKTHNAEAILADYRDSGEKLWDRFNGGREGTLWYYRSLADAFSKALPGKLASRLARSVKEMQIVSREEVEARSDAIARLHVPLLQPEDIIRHLGKGEQHWLKGRSAYELAMSWGLRNDVPPKVRAVLNSCPDYRGTTLVDGFFERATDLRTPGRASQTDLLAILSREGALAVAAVEGKVDESFGPRVAKWLGGRSGVGDPGSRKPERLRSLCAKLGLDPQAIGHLRYQLLHRAASAIYEAQRYCAPSALLLVHSFSPEKAGFGDYQDFAGMLGLPSLSVDSISSAVHLDGVELRLGWVGDRVSP